MQNGAKRVYAVDVGESLLHESLQNDPRIIRMENTNARYVTAQDFQEKIDGVVTDVSFISLRLIFPAIKSILGDGAKVVRVMPNTPALVGAGMTAICRDGASDEDSATASAIFSSVGETLISDQLHIDAIVGVLMEKNHLKEKEIDDIFSKTAVNQK